MSVDIYWTLTGLIIGTVNWQWLHLYRTAPNSFNIYTETLTKGSTFTTIYEQQHALGLNLLSSLWIKRQSVRYTYKVYKALRKMHVSKCGSTTEQDVIRDWLHNTDLESILWAAWALWKISQPGCPPPLVPPHPKKSTNQALIHHHRCLLEVIVHNIPDFFTKQPTHDNLPLTFCSI